MSKRASDLAARLRTAATGRAEASPTPPGPAAADEAPARRRRPARATAPAAPAPPAAPPKAAERERSKAAERERPVHVSLDLAPDVHRALRIAALDLRTDISAIVRALISEFRTDERLARRIAAELRRR